MITHLCHTQKTDAAVATSVIQKELVDRLLPVAMEGLERLYIPDAKAFCRTGVRDERGAVALEGVSMRYTAMALIGLSAQAKVGLHCRRDYSAALTHLVDWAMSKAPAGDLALVLWVLALRQDGRADDVLNLIDVRRAELLSPAASGDSMELGWLLTGLGQWLMWKGQSPWVVDLATAAAEKLLLNQSVASGLFTLSGRGGVRGAVIPLRRRLGSFASQVYPVVGLSYCATAMGWRHLAASARLCADRLCCLQGTAGQWWWVYSVRYGRAVMRYPVYSVHQDAMGPMALLAVGQTLGIDLYDPAISASLEWMTRHPECPDEEMIDASQGLIWRAVQRDPRADTGAFGLGHAERRLLWLAAWTDRVDRRAFHGGHVCHECRPYHLGWILLAAAMAQGRRTPGR
ncbi:MAG: hypothetical protein ABFD92_17265 [Planctomycetaceae bacterium]|nr:hypothetical protein [Planctomycetaceae bacterium]